MTKPLFPDVRAFLLLFIFFLASEMHVRAVIHAFLMFLFTLFYFIPPETRVQLLVHASLISYLLKMYELL